MGSIYNTSLNTMAKTRTLTATFQDGTVETRKTARTYTHIVRAFHNEIPFFFTWCGRTDLMRNQVKQAKKRGATRIDVAEVNDPWAA